MNSLNKYSYQGVSFWVHDLDLWLPFYGGNKVRKLQSIIQEIEASQKDAIVTTGGIQSNHCRVTSLFAAQNGYKCILILHGDKSKFCEQKGNAVLMRMSGADCRIVFPEEISSSMDKAMLELQEKGFNPYYLNGGGHHKLGVQAYIDAIDELEKMESDNIPFPDHIVLASGTGSTQAGIAVGLKNAGRTGTKVHGISIAREKKRGLDGVLEAISLVSDSNFEQDIKFHEQYRFGGYGRSSNNLQDFVKDVAAQTGIITDTCYTGKALYGMIDLAKKKEIKGNILFWHTGGLLNLMA